ncbi:hypothetical protein AGDE_15458 [Angomonas deanei]|nr:hypothetical protein AGDE_15458 [Angomonas deanei]|eukprot:EPY19060.1 hypothetical protein AGDE_15458 [Angomonas deanei]
MTWSPRLEKDLTDKAQLSVFYIQQLEHVIQHYLEELNKPIYKSGPVTTAQTEEKDGNEKKIQFWLSEHESVWMTLKELRLFQQEQKEKEKGNKNENDEEEIHHEENNENENDDIVMKTETELDLQEENDNHNHNNALTLSANTLARYSNALPGMPLLPPVDYNLFDWCIRLGLCTQSAIYYYYPRIFQEWRYDLREMIQYEKNNEKNKETLRKKLLLETDPQAVSVMQQLVEDPSLQLPEELVQLVETVLYKREKLQL